MAIFITAIVMGFVFGVAILEIADNKKIKYGLGLTFIAISLFCLVAVSYNFFLSKNPNPASMQIITSGQAASTTDCYGRIDIRVNGIALKHLVANEPWAQETRTGDGADTASVTFVEGNSYTIYKQNGLILHNYIVVCDK